MKTKIIAGKNERSIRMHLEAYLDKEDLEREDQIIIDVNYLLKEERRPSEVTWLDTVRECASDQKMIVILVGFTSEEHLSRSDAFVEVMSLPNVGFVDLLDPRRLPDVYWELCSGLKRADITAKAVYAFKQRQYKIDRLRHEGIYSYLHLKDAKGWLTQARALGFSGSDEEIFEQIRRWRADTAAEFDGVVLEGIFVEVYGTLCNLDWTFVPQVQEAVEALAAEKNRMIFAITDKDQRLVSRRLGNYGICWPVISKSEISGAMLEIVFHNPDREDGLSNYGIKAREIIGGAKLQY